MPADFNGTMPTMTGDAMAREMIKVRPDIPIVINSGHSDILDEEKAREIGVRAMLMKPVRREHLAETIRGILEGDA